MDFNAFPIPKVPSTKTVNTEEFVASPQPESQPKRISSAEKYQEQRRFLTDAEVQAYRELLFGGQAYADYVDAHSDLSKAYDRYLENNPDITLAMTKGEWGKQHYETYGKQEQGRNVSMLTDEAKESRLDSLIQGMSDIEGEKQFRALTLDVLKQTVDELNKAKAQENKMAVFQGMPGFSDISNLKSNIVNSFIGDSGLGGYLSIMGASDLKKKLENTIGGIVGTNNSVAYNWQKWFDETLTKRYEELSEIKDPTDAEKTYQIEKEYAQAFINDYLKPRFDYSRSMNEFIDYIDVDPSNENILQTQTVSNKLKEIGRLKTQNFLEDLQKNSGGIGIFDADFYFNPTGGTLEKEPLYQEQKTRVDRDWTKAKTNPKEIVNGKTWEQWSYEYGLDLNSKEDFAKLHYDLIGKSANFDPSSDFATSKDLLRYLNEELAPELQKEKSSLGENVFLDFVPVEQYADGLIGNIDDFTEFDESWNEFFEENGINPEEGLEETKELVKEVLRTGSASDIRMGIEALNKQKKKPTQELLGIEYIQRDEDYVPVDEYESDSYLYKLAQKSGYEGTEEEFYEEDFMEGITPGDQKFISDVMSGDFLKDFKDTSLSGDPFSAFSSMSSIESKFDIFGTEEKETEDYNEEEEKTDYFDLFGDSEEEEDDQSFGSLVSLFG